MVFNEEIVVIDPPPSPCPHQPKRAKQSSHLKQPPSQTSSVLPATCRTANNKVKVYPSSWSNLSHSSSSCSVTARSSYLATVNCRQQHHYQQQRQNRISCTPANLASEASASPTSFTSLPLPNATAATSQTSSSQQQLLIRRKFVDIVKRLCSQLMNKMMSQTNKSTQHQDSKIKDLKQVAPLQVPKEETEATEPVQLGDAILLRKTSPNGKVTVYMPKIEFEDLGCVTEPVEGIVSFDSSKLELGEKVYIALVGRFRYGREEDEILGMSLCREIYMGYAPVCSARRRLSPEGLSGSYPRSPQYRNKEPVAGPSSGITPQVELQKASTERRILSRYAIPLSSFHQSTLLCLTADSIPFRFEFPGDAPVSMVMQRTTPDSGDTCGVRYYIRCYSCLDIDEQQTTISLLNFPIKKVQYVSLARNLLDNNDSPVYPKGTIFKEFPLNGGSLSLEATLNKALYLHGEEIRVKIHLSNSSHKTIKHVKVSVLQVADICLFSTGKWKVCVATTNNRNDCPINSGNSIEQEVVLVPKLGDNKHKYGVFVQSRSGPEPDCLASSTVVSEEQRKNLFGIVVDYEVKVKLCLGTLSSLSGFKTWMCSGVKGLVDELASPTSSPPKTPSTPEQRRGEITCFIPFQIHHSGPADIPLPGQISETGHRTASNGSLRISSASTVEPMD
ncbi:beta-arrestin-1-like isoform X1 [Varroa jacobsoni]|uniref:beta-arrestin-1-like isoform X1 n=1 Tax=Varroa jacobsoni TaxID=62625 RepID=UPI000BF4BD86|nr:beta-arrestin-1-like isoform X1 [Varroa jacobsoni]